MRDIQMTIALVILAIVLAASGFLFLSQATVGVGIIATACLVAIIAPIAQAQHCELHHAAKSAPEPGVNYRDRDAAQG